MNNKIEINFIDEVLKISWLEGIKEADIYTSEKEIHNILEMNYSHVPDPNRIDCMIQDLRTNSTIQTFGELLKSIMLEKQLNEKSVADSSGLPSNIIQDLKDDKIYINNIPIMLLKGLLEIFDLPFKKAEEAILHSFKVMKSQMFINEDQLSGFQIAFRKTQTNLSANRTSSSGTKGSQLYENEASLKKYLSRLNELMNS